MTQPEFAARIEAYMNANGMTLSKDKGTLNIVYIEGCNHDGTPNADLPNRWNDRRLVLSFYGSGFQIKLNYRATTEPGKYYTQNPLHKYGAARIAFGQYKAWQFGKHQGVQPALVQVAPVKVHRDINRDGKRSPNDPIDTGIFGINQHTTKFGTPPAEVGKYSAGCLVGWSYAQHIEFLDLVATDVRYLDSRKDFIFETAILPGDKFFSFHV